VADDRQQVIEEFEMHVLQIGHPIRDFDTWKGAFDRFSAEGGQAGS
jgi:hypothetical protein